MTNGTTRTKAARSDGRATLGRDAMPTGIAGLDEFLDGGLSRGDLYLIAGPLGVGKTTLGNQVAYAQAKAGAVAIYATVLAETHERMLMHLANFAFFAPEMVAKRVHYISLYDELGSAGLSGALMLLRRMVREHRASLLVVDGASLFDDFAPSAVEFRRFTSQLHAQLAALGCTTLFLADDDGHSSTAIGFQVDGIVTLEDDSIGLRDVRLLRVAKLRGANPLRGRHHFTIGPRGLDVFPRLEASVARRQQSAANYSDQALQKFGIVGLDQMLGGGLPPASTTLLLGVPGTGKTCMGLAFIVEGANAGEPGLIATLDERPSHLIQQAAALGFDLGGHVESGLVNILWHLPLDLSLDAWVRELLSAVETSDVRRVFIDPAGAVREMDVYSDRLSSLLPALIGDLRQRGVGAVFAAELRSVVGTQLEVPPPSFPVLLDNAILLRYHEHGSELRRLVSVLKVTGTAHDTSLRWLTIDAAELRVGDIVGDYPGPPGVSTVGEAE